MAAVSASAIAQSGLTDCRAINDPSARLACYDQLDAGTETPVADGENAATVAPAARALSRDERTHPAIAQRHSDGSPDTLSQRWEQIGRASCRERVCQYV